MSDRNQLKKGDLVRIMTAGGGGWGSPLQRPAQQVRLDVLDGFISRESAHADYGVVLSSELELDTPATQELRAQLSQQQAAEVKMFHRGSYYDA
jgi:N-methylhydantoinase B